MGSPAIDYDALARQHGLTPAPIDYDALAKAHGLTPAEQPGAVSRFVQGTGIPGTLNALMKPSDKPSDPAHPYADAPIIKNAWEMVKSIGQATKDRLARADKAEEDGDYLGAIGHGLAAIPGAGEMGAQIIQNFRDGNIAGGMGGLATVFGPKAVKAASPAIADAAGVASTAAGGVASGLKSMEWSDIKPATVASMGAVEGAGALAHMIDPHLGYAVQGAGAAIPFVKAGIKGASEALAARSQALASAAQGPVPLTPQQAAVIEATAAAKTARASAPTPQPATLLNISQTTPEIQAQAAQILAANRAARQAASPSIPLTPQQQAIVQATAAAKGQAAAAQPVTMDWSGLSDPATLEQAARQLAANRASRAAANPQSAAATIDRIKAISKSLSMRDLAVPHDLNSQLQQMLTKVRVATPGMYEPEPVAPETDWAELMQRSADQINAKKAGGK